MCESQLRRKVSTESLGVEVQPHQPRVCCCFKNSFLYLFQGTSGLIRLLLYFFNNSDSQGQSGELG